MKQKRFDNHQLDMLRWVKQGARWYDIDSRTRNSSRFYGCDIMAGIADSFVGRVIINGI